MVKTFTDYDRIVQPVREGWLFVGANFNPHEDGLTLHVTLPDAPKEKVYRFKWTEEEQSELAQDFRNFITEV